MEQINLTPLKNELEDEELQDYELGDVVEVPQGVGIVAATADSSFEFPTSGGDSVSEGTADDADTKKVEASSDNPVYIVALQDGGSVVVSADEIDSDASLKDDDGEDVTSEDDVSQKAGEAELASVYSYAEGDPHSMAVLQDAKSKMVQERQAADLADYIESEDKDLEELEAMSAEELVNIPGVDDPHVGFDSMPNGWTRKSVLQAWATLGGMWRTCFARMVVHFGPRMAKRWCAALKDEVLGTEMWRGKF